MLKSRLLFIFTTFPLIKCFDVEALTDTVKLKGFSNYFFFEVQRALLVGVSVASVSSALTNIAPLLGSVNPFANFFSLFFLSLAMWGFQGSKR